MTRLRLMLSTVITLRCFSHLATSTAMVSTRSGKRMAAAALVSAEPPRKPTTKRSKSSSSSSSVVFDPPKPKLKSKLKSKPKKTKKTPTKKEKIETSITSATCASDPLLMLSSECVEATLICRPSKRNRSPYVADVQLVVSDSDDAHDDDKNRIAICHMPNLDMGGKCAALGTRLWIVPLRDKKTGLLVGANAVSPKYGTPKCEFSARLVHVDESALHSNYIPTWVGGHPGLGETLAEELLARHQQGVISIPGMEDTTVTAIKKQVMTGPHTRADFVLETITASSSSSLQVDNENNKPKTRQRIVEVKTVVDTDYCASWPLPERRKCVFVSQAGSSDDDDYQRTALFPWGQSKQKGPDGEHVVSTRAIKHVRELTQLVRDGTYDATILFLVIRGDAHVFRPNHEACPSFAKYLKEAHDAGVQVLAKRVRWDDTEIGTCYDDKWLDVVFPNLSTVEGGNSSNA